jgi:hypothetical protein
MSRRKRAPGAGAKPRGPFRGKSATLTTRITPETRAELERSAQEQGRSLSQEVEARLRDFTRQNQGPPHIRSFADAISMLFFRIESKTGECSLDDPFTAAAVRQAISAFTWRLLPSSDQPAIPSRIKVTVDKAPALNGWLNPSTLGELVCAELIYAIENAPLTNHEVPGLSYPAPEGLSRIRDDLAVGTSEEKKR